MNDHTDATRPDGSVTLADVRAAMRQRYAAMGPPSWPAPHPNFGEPAPEEYSRVTAPERWRALPMRAFAWAQACASLLGAHIAEESGGAPLDLTPALLQDAGEQHHLVIRVTSPAQDTTPLFITAWEHEGWSVTLSLGCPEAAVETSPGCGCDACDDGSDFYLDEIDRFFESALRGDLVHIQGRGWSATVRDGHRSGGSWTDSAAVDPAEGMALAEAIAAGDRPQLPPDTVAGHGAPWV